MIVCNVKIVARNTPGRWVKGLLDCFAEEPLSSHSCLPVAFRDGKIDLFVCGRNTALLHADNPGWPYKELV